MDHLASEEHRLLRTNVRKFAESRILPAAAEIDRTDRFPAEIYRAIGEMGLFGVCLPEEAGGSGMDAVAACIAMEEIARCSGAVGNCFANAVEVGLFLHQHGGDVHKAFLPGLLAGTVFPSTAVSEPDHGSDVASMTTTAVEDAGGYVLNGTKAWVTLGGVASIIIVFAKTAKDSGNRGISAFLVEGDRKGIARGKIEHLLGMHGLEDCQIAFQDVRIPVANRIGAENQAFKMAMVNFNFGRIMMAALALGMAQAAFGDAVTYARSRKQFGTEIINHQAVQFMLADMSVEIAAARLLIHHAAVLHDRGLPAAKESSHAKLFTTDMAVRNISNALQIHGGNGYSKEYRLERLYRDVRLTQIYEGTNQIQRLIIARQIQKESRQEP